MSDITEKNFNLTEIEFNALLSRLKAGDNELFKRIFLSQAEESIIYIQNSFNGSYDKAYDAVIESILMIRERMIQGKVVYGNLKFLLTSIAAQYYQRQHKFAVPVIDTEINYFADTLSEEEQFDESQITLLNKAIKMLGDQCQEILKMNYFLDMNLNEIADKLEKGHDAIRKQKQRCKDQLKEIYLKLK
ncbi:MAG TPA: sigma-70 family RNA polymerase sigma factor [Saprospiraceae bacterium]|nr:sigma-70 family RNA polymerase sigma factor [Saprospiraceae bacterium]HPN69374.1 sigma-70 family RNA polymerase sigma factor [Saprospiraceae bacterium]